MTKQEAINVLLFDAERSNCSICRYKGMCNDDYVICDIANDIAIECIENLDILIDYVAGYDNQDNICDDLYGYDEVDDDSWCSRNCKNFNRECVLKWLEWKRGDNE